MLSEGLFTEMAKKAFKPWPAKFNAAVLMGLLLP
jgi:hypothetical protein